MLKFSEIFEFSKEKFRKIPILKEFEWFEWFEWFGPSPIEPFNSGLSRGFDFPPRPPSAGVDALEFRPPVGLADLDASLHITMVNPKLLLAFNEFNARDGKEMLVTGILPDGGRGGKWAVDTHGKL